MKKTPAGGGEVLRGELGFVDEQVEVHTHAQSQRGTSKERWCVCVLIRMCIYKDKGESDRDGCLVESARCSVGCDVSV